MQNVTGEIIVLIWDGRSEHVAHACRKIGLIEEKYPKERERDKLQENRRPLSNRNPERIHYIYGSSSSVQNLSVGFFYVVKTKTPPASSGQYT